MDQNLTTTEAVTLEVKISNEIKKFNVADSAIAELKEQYKDLKIAGVEDKEGFEKVTAARKHVKKLRTAVEGTRKEITEDYVKFKKAIDEEATRLKNLLLEIEKPLEKMEEDHLAEKKRLIEEKERKEQERIQNRVNQLFSYGMTFNGSVYSIGEGNSIVIDSISVKNYSDDEFEKFIDSVKVEHEKELARKAEKERTEALQKERNAELLSYGFQYPFDDLGTMTDFAYEKMRDEHKKAFEEKEKQRKAEEERLEKVRQQQEEERIRLETQAKEQAEKERNLREEQERIQAEKADMLQKRNSSRAKELSNLGLVFNGENFILQDVMVSLDTVESVNDSVWSGIISEITPKVVNIKEEEENIRKEKAKKEAEEKIRKESEAKAEAERLAKEEADRQEALRPDKEKLLLFAEHVCNIQHPAVSNPKAILILEDAQTMLEGARDFISKEVEKL